jgi:hypothetical protein
MLFDHRLGYSTLMDPVSALYFGQFILGCQFHFDSIEQLSKIGDTRDLCWRLDHVPHDNPSFSQCSLPTEADTL